MAGLKTSAGPRGLRNRSGGAGNPLSAGQWDRTAGRRATSLLARPLSAAMRCPAAGSSSRRAPSPLRDALYRRVILREDTSASITGDEVVTSQTTKLTSQP